MSLGAQKTIRNITERVEFHCYMDKVKSGKQQKTNLIFTLQLTQFFSIGFSAYVLSLI